MRSFILGILALMAVPAYAVGQQRDRSERSATGRTAYRGKRPLRLHQRGSAIVVPSRAGRQERRHRANRSQMTPRCRGRAASTGARRAPLKPSAEAFVTRVHRAPARAHTRRIRR